jgi:hypothetical protein
MDSVERQLRAYNEHDVDAFVACYAESVVVEDADGAALIDGREQMREQYARLFEGAPDVHARIAQRIRVGTYVIDEEHVSGRPDGDLHVVAIYRLDADGRIERVRFLR